MARVVESVAEGFGKAVHWEKVVTKELAGATRSMDLSKRLGRPVPVPSIFINGELAYAMTPAPEDLEARIRQMLSQTIS
jgi:hypothetical protein